MNLNALNESYGTMSQTINALTKLGYEHDFNIQQDCLVCLRAGISLMPEEFQIDHVYRFDGDSDPDYQAILYAISSPQFGVKGLLVDGYGIASDANTAKVIEKLEIHRKQSGATSPKNNLVAETDKLNLANKDINSETAKVKANEATPQRPMGDRLIDAPMVELDLQAAMQQLKGESTWTESDRNSLTLFKSDTMRIVLVGLHAHAEMKPHQASGQISVHVLQGQIEFTTHPQAPQNAPHPVNTPHQAVPDGQDQINQAATSTHALNQQATLKVGQMVTLHENIMHSVKAVQDSFFMLTLAMPK